MSITTDEAELTIQQVSRRTGLAESTLRYYERIGLIDAVPRDQSSGHRRYPPDLVAAIESLSCLRGTKMSVHDMRAYVVNMRRGRVAAADHGSCSPATRTGCEARSHDYDSGSDTFRPRPTSGRPDTAVMRPPKLPSRPK